MPHVSEVQISQKRSKKRFKKYPKIDCRAFAFSSVIKILCIIAFIQKLFSIFFKHYLSSLFSQSQSGFSMSAPAGTAYTYNSSGQRQCENISLDVSHSQLGSHP